MNLSLRNNDIIKTMYEVNIDFDEASKCWHQNKIRLANGCYDYKKTQCCAMTKKNVQCKRLTKGSYCPIHNK